MTIADLTQTGGGELKLAGAEGESLSGPIPRIGNIKSRLRFAWPPGEFIDRRCTEGPSLHGAPGIRRRIRAPKKRSEICPTFRRPWRRRSRPHEDRARIVGEFASIVYC